MIVSIGLYVGLGYSSVIKDRHYAGFIAHYRQEFLITEIGCFLIQKFVRTKEMVIDCQAYFAYFRAFLSDVESVLAAPRLRENS
jgi:hypothetical protein